MIVLTSFYKFKIFLRFITKKWKNLPSNKLPLHSFKLKNTPGDRRLFQGEKIKLTGFRYTVPPYTRTKLYFDFSVKEAEVSGYF